MSMHLKTPLCSLRRIGIKPWFILRRHHNDILLSRHPFTSKHLLAQTTILISNRLRSHSTSTALESLDTHSISSINNNSKLENDHQQIPNDSHEKLMTTLADQGAWEQVIQTFQDLQSNIYKTSRMYLLTITACGHLNHSEQATKIFNEYKKQHRVESIAYQQYLKVILNCNDLPKALQIFRNISHQLTPKEASACLAEVISAFYASNKKKHLILAIKATETLSQSIKDWDTDAKPKLISSLWNIYLKLLKLPLDDISPTSVESLVSNYTASALPLKPLVSLLKLLSQNDDGFVPTVQTCNLILDVQSTQKDYAGIKSVIGFMQHLNMNPTIDTISILLRTFGNSLDENEAEKLYNDLAQHHNPNVYNAFIQIFNKQPLQIQKVISDMKTNQLDIDSTCFAAMAHGFSKRNDYEKGFEWLQNASCQHLDSYAILIEGLLHRGEWKECIARYLGLMNSFGPQQVCTNQRLVKSMLAAQFAQNNMIECDRFLSSANTIEFTTNTIKHIVDTLLTLETRNGNPLVSGQKAIKALKMMESRLHLYLDAQEIGHIIAQLGHRGECVQGYQLYRWVRESGHEKSRERCGYGHIYIAMIANATENNDMKILERAWVDMQYRRQFFGLPCVKQVHDVAGYNLLLNGYASYLPRPKLSRVKKVFQKMLNQDLNPNLITYNILIKAFVKANNMDAANEIFKKMLDDSSIQPDATTTNTLLHGWIIRKDWSQVERFVQDLKQKSGVLNNLDVVTFNLLVQSFLQLDAKSVVKGKYQTEKSKMTSETIWNIFQSTTGYDPTMIDIPRNQNVQLTSTDFISLCDQLCQLEPFDTSPHQQAFVKLFSDTTEANQVTYKLFMKAFVNIGDYQSASKIYQWMKYRLSM